MKILKTELSKLIIDSLRTDIADVYFFEDVVVVEMFEGIHADRETALETMTMIADYYDGKPFGYISNRINNYSVTPLDYPKMFETLRSLNIFAVVNHNFFGKKNFKVEKRFCGKKIKSYDDLCIAYREVHKLLEKQIENFSFKNCNSMIQYA